MRCNAMERLANLARGSCRGLDPAPDIRQDRLKSTQDGRLGEKQENLGKRGKAERRE